MNEHPTGRRTGYHDDFYAWTQQQAKLLRALQRLGPKLPVQIDFPHLAEEVEDLGKAELRGTISLIRQIMIHLIKAVSDPASDALPHWRTEAKTFHSDLLGFFEPSMRQRISLQKLWTRALDLADSSLRERGAFVNPDLPDRCPFALQDFVSEEFDWEAGLARLSSESQ